jgi:hypothetical protein
VEDGPNLEEMERDSEGGKEMEMVVTIAKIPGPIAWTESRGSIIVADGS